MKLFTLATAPAAIAMIIYVSGASAISQIAYLTYSNDDQCRELSLAKAVLNAVPFSIPILSDATQPCSDLVACAIDDSSPQCARVGGSADMEHATLSVQIRNLGKEVWECDTSNEAAGENPCDFKSPDACFASSILPGCYARYITAERFQELVFEAVESCEKAPTSGGSRLLTIFN